MNASKILRRIIAACAAAVGSGALVTAPAQASFIACDSLTFRRASE